MDPNEALSVLRHLAEAGLAYAEGIQEHEDGMSEAEEGLSGTIVEIVTQFQALDEWLSRGGFPPEVWREGPDAFGEELPAYLTRLPSGEVVRVSAVGHDDRAILPDDDDGIPAEELAAINAYRARHGIDPLGPPNPAHGELPDHDCTMPDRDHWVLPVRDDDYTTEAINRTAD